MKVSPCPVWGVEYGFEADDTAVIKAGHSMMTIVNGRWSSHFTGDGIGSVTMHHKQEDERSFVCLTTESGTQVFLSLEQAHAIGAAAAIGTAADTELVGAEG